jgi:hypothetical protein
MDEKNAFVHSFAIIDSINRDLHTSLVPLAGLAPSFMMTYVERKSGVIRSRLVENKMDPNLSYDMRKLSNQEKRAIRQKRIGKKWGMNDSLL